MARPDPLVELLDEARAVTAGAARARTRWLQRQAEETATLAGTLVDLAERTTPVVVGTRAGRTTSGTVLAVGIDVVVLRDRAGRHACLALAAVATVRPQPGERLVAASGDRGAPLDLHLGEVLARLAPERPRLAVVTAAGELLAGELRAVGADVVTLRLDGDRTDALVYLAVAALDEALLEPP